MILFGVGDRRMKQTILIDTSCVLASIDIASTYHKQTIAIMRNKNYQRIIPAPILSEVSHLLTVRLGYEFYTTIYYQLGN